MTNHRNSRPRVCAVSVIYHPCPETLRRSLLAVLPQVDRIVVVNNGCAAETRALLEGLAAEHGLALIEAGANLGVAAAHNLGARWAAGHGYSHVLLLDHDSIPSAGMVERLLAAEGMLRAQGRAVAAVGPAFFDGRFSRYLPFIRLAGWRIRKERCGGAQRFIPADYLISSGTLIALSTFEALGGMDKALFVDYVDIEWGLRARGKGYGCFGVCPAAMQHHLGDAVIRLAWLGGRELSLYSPLRYYYLVRNAVLLYHRPYIPLAWKLNDAVRLLARCAIVVATQGRRLSYLGMMGRGLWHGLRARAGGLEAARVDAPGRDGG